jgi:hypothetical protein
MSEVDGILHLWCLPENEVYVELNESFKDKLCVTVKSLFGGYKKACKAINEPYYEFESFVRGHSKRLSFITKFISCLSEKSSIFTMRELEKNVKSISSRAGHKIFNPKLPFNFNTQEGAVIIASALHDGCITKTHHFVYFNKDEVLINRLKAAVRSVIGDVVPKERKHKNGLIEVCYPNVVGYILTSLGLMAGDKVDNDVGVLKFLFSTPKEMISEFLGQAIAEDGAITFDRKNHTRQVTIAFAKGVEETIARGRELVKNFESVPRLLKDHMELLRVLGIKAKGPYFMKRKHHKRKPRFAYTWFITIADRENLEKLRAEVRIPLERKQWVLDEILASYSQLWNGQLGKLIIRQIQSGESTVPRIARALERNRETVREVMNKLMKLSILRLAEPGSGAKPNVYVLNPRGAQDA